MNFNDDKFRKTTIIKLVFLCVAIVFPIILASVLGYFEKSIIDSLPFSLKVLRIIVLVLLELFIVIKIAFYIKLLCKPDFMSDVILKKKDERLIFIKQKTYSFSLKMSLYLNVIAIIVSGFINQIIFYTLVGTLVTILLTTFITTFYYYKKY